MELKMKKSRNWPIAMTIIATLSFTSCNKDVERALGDWDPMIWKTEAQTTQKDDAYIIDANGGEITFICSNYSDSWLSSADSLDKHYYITHEYGITRSYDADWFKADINENMLKVTFKANPNSVERPLKLTVTAGDIFHAFNFKQSAKK